MYGMHRRFNNLTICIYRSGNKLCVHFGCLQMSVLVRLFKTYCCTFYGCVKC